MGWGGGGGGGGGVAGEADATSTSPKFDLFDLWEKKKKRLTPEDRVKKIRTYKLIKQTYLSIETYLDNLPDKNIRKSLCCFRISAHRLRIEHGRY